MAGVHDLAFFVMAGLLLNISPGPDTVYIAGRSATQGFRGGAVAAFGIFAGCFVHIAAAAIGLSALIMASANAFLVLKLVGAAYLFYVGCTMLLARTSGIGGRQTLARARLSTIFWQGCLTNALNPKVALFFLAFVPQFIAADAPHKALAFVALGVLFNVNSVFWNLFVAWSAHRVAGGVRRGRAALWVNRSVGAMFVAMGARLAILERG